ncbi:MAG: F0F1 ATP synthase subunit gamma [Anaerolineaceae bacterium]|jgi:ATP synthase F1 gamma subunit|nr:F0F1 ATP synthase subunit gamma [Anaerolineaceae bacterium]
MDIERTQARLENAETVEPMLGALRTISLGTWQSAVNRRQGLKTTSREYDAMLASLMPALMKIREAKKRPAAQEARCDRQVVVLAGTERGLCGRLDQDLIDFAKQSPELVRSMESSEFVVIGGRLSKAVARQLAAPEKTYSASSTALPAFPEVFGMIQGWLQRLANHELGRVLVFFTAFHGATQREPSVIQLLPYELDLGASGHSESWPPPIIETDPAQLFVRIYEQLAAIRLYDVLLQTKAAIHSARFQMMEDSTKNAERLIEELTIILQTERRQAITREMQELAVGAGLLQH